MRKCILSFLLLLLLCDAFSQHKSLFQAIVVRDYNKVTSLLKAGTDINGIYQQETALTIATLTGDRSMAAFLISRGAEVSGRNYQVLQYALQFGMADLIGLYAGQIPAINWSRFLPYHAVVLEFPVQFAMWTLEDYMPPRSSTVSFDPASLPLLRVTNNRLRVIAAIDTLLAYHAPVDLADPDGQTALDAAMELEKPNLDLVLYLMKNRFPASGDISPGRLAHIGVLAAKDSFVVDIVKRNRGVINAVREGNPLLHAALLSGRNGLADSLMLLGATPGLKGRMGRNAAHAAAIGNCAQFFEKYRNQLLPLVIQKDSGGLNSLETAVVYGNDLFKDLMLRYYLDTAGISSRVFPLIETLRNESDSIGFTEGTFRFADQMIQRNHFRYSQDTTDLEPLIRYAETTTPSPSTIVHFINIAAHVNNVSFTTVIFKKWYPQLNLHQKTALLNMPVDRSAILFFLATQPDATGLWPLIAGWKTGYNILNENLERLTIVTAHAGNWDFLKNIIDDGAPVNDSAANYSLLFAVTAKEAPVEIVQYLLTRNAQLTDKEADILYETQSYLENRPKLLQYVLTMKLLRKQMLTVNPTGDYPLNRPLLLRRRDLVLFDSLARLQPSGIYMDLRQLPSRFVTGFPDRMKVGGRISFPTYGDMSLRLSEWDYPSGNHGKQTMKQYVLEANAPDFGHLPYINMGSVSPDLQKNKLRTETQLFFSLPFIPYDTLYPVSFPIATIKNNDYDKANALIKVAHLGKIESVISPDKEKNFDLSVAGVSAKMSLTAMKALWLNISITMQEGLGIDTPVNNQFIERLKYYQKIDAVHRRILSESISTESNYKHTFENKKLLTVLHMMSEYAVQHNFLYAIQQEIKTELTGISNYNTQVKHIYSVLNQVLINPGEKEQLLQLLSGLVNATGNPELQQKLQKLKAQILSSDSPLKWIEAVAAFLRDGVFSPVNHSVIHIQALLFELSQFLTKGHLQEMFDKHLKIPSDNRLWNSNNLVIREADMNGKGSIIIKNLIPGK